MYPQKKTTMKISKILFFVSLFTIAGVKAEFDIGDAISDGFIHAAVSDVVKEPIKNAINPTFESYYVCTDSDFLSNQCHTNVLTYTVVTPPSPVVLFITLLLTILFLISFVVWCAVSSCEEKLEMVAYICCHIIGGIIYDMLCGDDDD
tara:strand:+ start:1744 stop:2187 length:444 start_codon:yes stop_codon:yes gene_type:complete